MHIEAGTMAEWASLAWTILAALVTGPVLIILWVEKRFKATSDLLYKFKAALDEKLTAHEEEDDTRHLQNLAAIGDMTVALAENGIRVQNTGRITGPTRY